MRNLSKYNDPPPGPFAEKYKLSWAQEQVALLAIDGVDNNAIAIRLGISAQAVKNRLSVVFTKLNITGKKGECRAALIRIANEMQAKGA